jgi:hypothetical protein
MNTVPVSAQTVCIQCCLDSSQPSTIFCRNSVQYKVLQLLLAIVYFLVIEKYKNKFGLIKKNFIIYIKSILKNLAEGWKCSLGLRQPKILQQSLYS